MYHFIDSSFGADPIDELTSTNQYASPNLYNHFTYMPGYLVPPKWYERLPNSLKKYCSTPSEIKHPLIHDGKNCSHHLPSYHRIQHQRDGEYIPDKKSSRRRQTYDQSIPLPHPQLKTLSPHPSAGTTLNHIKNTDYQSRQFHRASPGQLKLVFRYLHIHLYRDHNYSLF